MTTTRLNYIEIPAPDLAAAKAFYHKNFGWKVVDYGPAYAACDADGVEVGLAADSVVASRPEPGSQASVGPLVLLQTDDLDAVHESLVEGGAEIVTASFDYPGGRRFHFADPNGNILGVYQATVTTNDAQP